MFITNKNHIILLVLFIEALHKSISEEGRNKGL